MKSLIVSVSLSLALLSICINTFMGVRFNATMIRAGVVFGVVFVAGMILALVIFIPTVSTRKQPGISVPKQVTGKK